MWYVCVRARQSQSQYVPLLHSIFLPFFFWRFCCGFSTVASSCLGIYGMCVFARTSESEPSRVCWLRFTLTHMFSFFFCCALRALIAAAGAQGALCLNSCLSSCLRALLSNEAHRSPNAAGALRCAAAAALLAAVSCVLRFSSSNAAACCCVLRASFQLQQQCCCCLLRASFHIQSNCPHAPANAHTQARSLARARIHTHAYMRVGGGEESLWTFW